MSIFSDQSFQARVKAILIWASEQIESEAECLKEACTNFDGKWDDLETKQTYESEKQKVAEMDDLLRLIAEGGQ